MVYLERHVARIARDAALLGLGAVDPDACRERLRAEASRAFPDGEGIVRLEARAGADGRVALQAKARPLDADPPWWRAVVAREPHPGPTPWSVAKAIERGVYERALAAAVGVDEALLVDAHGFLVEGARTSLVVVLASGALATPPLARGGQAGIARGILLERMPELAEADVALAALAEARELVAVNAVRGARPIVALDGRPVSAGAPGPWLERLARALAAG